MPPNELLRARKLIKKCLATQDSSVFLAGCKITDLGELPELFSCTRLESLILCCNQISDIRPLAKLTGLQCLHLSNNQISDLRPLEHLTGLQYLNLAYNQISDIRPLAKLTGLQTLDLVYNQISDIRPLEHLTGLQDLDLAYNHLKEIPLFIFRLGLKITGWQWIRGIHLYANPIETPPLKIIKQGRKAVFRYFENLK